MTVNKEDLLSHNELLRVLSYDKITGVFLWKVRTANRVKVGNIAGSLNKGNGYIEIAIHTHLYLAHRLAWFYVTAEWPINLIDHKNNIRHENWFLNLREATHKVNQQNQQKPHSRNLSTSTIPGVSFIPSNNKWVVQLRVNNKNKFGGYYLTQQEAEDKCKELRRLYYGGNMI